METTAQHPLSQAFIQQASVIIGHRQEIRGVHPLNQNDIQRECDNIKAVSLRILQAGLEEQGGNYFFKFRLEGQGLQTRCDSADSPAVALYYGVQALKQDGIIHKLSFPKPIIKDLRQPPYTLDQEISVRSELRGLLSKFEAEVEEALSSTSHIEAQIDILQSILTDLESADWDDETAGSVLARWAVDRAKKWVEERYEFKVQEIAALSDDEKQSRGFVAHDVPLIESNKAPAFRLTIAHLALREIYEGRVPVTLEIGNRIARENGYSSGESLRQWYNDLSEEKDRVGENGPRQDKYMVRRIKQLLPLLSEAAIQRAERELKTIFARIDKK